MRESWRYLKQRRPAVRPHPNYWRQLQDLEVSKHGLQEPTITLHDAGIGRKHRKHRRKSSNEDIADRLARAEAATMSDSDESVSSSESDDDGAGLDMSDKSLEAQKEPSVMLVSGGGARVHQTPGSNSRGKKKDLKGVFRSFGSSGKGSWTDLRN